LNPRPLGYEPYDVCLCRLEPSLVTALASADRTDHISLRRLRLPRPVLSRRVRFTNRFTEQVIDLRFPAPFPASWWLPFLGAAAVRFSLAEKRETPCLSRSVWLTKRARRHP
jgi:hypothetical protein